MDDYFDYLNYVEGRCLNDTEDICGDDWDDVFSAHEEAGDYDWYSDEDDLCSAEEMLGAYE